MTHHSTLPIATDMPIPNHCNKPQIHFASPITIPHLLSLTPYLQSQNSPHLRPPLHPFLHYTKKTFQIPLFQRHKQRLFNPLKHQQGVWTKGRLQNFYPLYPSISTPLSTLSQATYTTKSNPDDFYH